MSRIDVAPQQTSPAPLPRRRSRSIPIRISSFDNLLWPMGLALSATDPCARGLGRIEGQRPSLEALMAERRMIKAAQDKHGRESRPPRPLATEGNKDLQSDDSDADLDAVLAPIGRMGRPMPPDAPLMPRSTSSRLPSCHYPAVPARRIQPRRLRPALPPNAEAVEAVPAEGLHRPTDESLPLFVQCKG